jgi:hypothetical protein
VKSLLSRLLTRFVGKTTCSTCGCNSFDPLTMTCLPCEDRARAMHRTYPGNGERTITNAGAVWHVADRWRDLEQGGRPRG